MKTLKKKQDRNHGDIKSQEEIDVKPFIQKV